MAVNRTLPRIIPEPGGGSPRGDLQNDAFSFWKLPEHWRTRLDGLILESRKVSERYLFERYLLEHQRRPRSRMSGLVPVALRHRLNHAAIRTRKTRDLPRWPCESALVEHLREWLQKILGIAGAGDGWHIGFWPEKKDCCVVLIHDVETAAGFGRMGQIADLEEKYGFGSCWNLPPDRYPIDWLMLKELRARGFEFGAHFAGPEGRMFSPRTHFILCKRAIERMSREHGLRGFRASSALRRAEWIAAIDLDFDSTFADTDPYQAQPGGTCSVFPFFISRIVELPYTLPQDRTLLRLPGRSLLPVWTLKARWIASLGGMILALTHPECVGSKPQLNAYEELLKHLAALESSWRALPSEVAAWWRRRSAMSLVIVGDQPKIVGPDARAAVARRLSEQRLAR
jgi:hypothetical protein